MPLPSWEGLIDGVRTWACVKNGKEERAVHKPLLILMILARAQQGGSNVFRFRDVDAPLREALRAFGAPRKSYRAEYPFWYLKDDGFWVVRDEARLGSLKKGAEPGRRLLLDEDAQAEVPLALWEELVQEPPRVARLIQKVLARHWAVEARGRVAAEVVFGLRVEEGVPAL